MSDGLLLSPFLEMTTEKNLFRLADHFFDDLLAKYNHLAMKSNINLQKLDHIGTVLSQRTIESSFSRLLSQPIFHFQICPNLIFIEPDRLHLHFGE